jgi:nitrate/TMAO reductase-like tetraheme cytochrome c subunit
MADRHRPWLTIMNCFRRHTIIIGLFALPILWINIQWSAAPTLTEPSAECASCHRSVFDSHNGTAHYLSSSPATAASIKGSFKTGRNRFIYNDRMDVLLEKKNNQFFQTASFNGALFESEPFDIVIGSGRKGQSYLYWDSVRLFQLPVSYYTPADSWCNSPGYPTNIVYFNKQVPGQCMECHATSARVLQLDNGAVGFNRNSIVYGITCERCHGPGAAHSTYHTAHPGEKEGKEIISSRRLSRQQRLDACALCHSGFRREIRPSFSFTVGDTLDNFSTPNYDVDSTKTLDVHGNQYGLLTASKCFKVAEQLDCSSCHNVHADEYGKAAVFSQRCQTCHSQPTQHSCSFPPVKELKLENNCIDCHMPALPSQKILLQLSGKAKPVHDLVRTHHIGIYPDISRRLADAARH